MSELAVVAARKVRLQQRADDGDERAKTALTLAHDPNKFLSTVQFGITMVGVLAGAYGGATIAEKLVPTISQVPQLVPYAEGIALGVVVAVITVLSLILGELVKMHNLAPKPEQVPRLVEEQAQSYELPEEVVKWFYAAPERLRDIESAALEDNVVAWALGTARVTDKQVDFDELMGKR